MSNVSTFSAWQSAVDCLLGEESDEARVAAAALLTTVLLDSSSCEAAAALCHARGGTTLVSVLLKIVVRLSSPSAECKER